MKRVVINSCYGGFGVSDEAKAILNLNLSFDIERDNENLVNLILEAGSGFVSGRFANLKVIELPDNVTDYRIVEYDGLESIVAVIDGKLVDFR